MLSLDAMMEEWWIECRRQRGSVSVWVCDKECECSLVEGAHGRR